VNPEPPKGFDDTFNHDVIELLLEVVRSTYALAIDCFDRARPYSDGHTFGTSLYRFSGHTLTEAAERCPDLIRMVQEHPSFIHQVGSFRLICHRVAKNADADIWSSFPNPDTEGVYRGATYFLPGLEPDLRNANTIVLAHIGNEHDGLCSLYLCVPITDDAQNLEWGYVREIYSQPIANVVDDDMPDPVAEPVDVEPAVVRRRVRRQSEQ
jgi:hypothetical protein